MRTYLRKTASVPTARKAKLRVRHRAGPGHFIKSFIKCQTTSALSVDSNNKLEKKKKTSLVRRLVSWPTPFAGQHKSEFCPFPFCEAAETKHFLQKQAEIQISVK